MDKQNVIYPYSGITISCKKEQSSDTKVSHIVLFHLYEISRIDNTRETESGLVVARDRQKGEMGNSCLLEIRFPFRVTKMFRSKIEVMVTQHECTKCH